MGRYSGLYNYSYKQKKAILSAKFFPKSFFLGFSYTHYRVAIHDRLDNIAFEYYGRGDMDWIIKYANGLDLPTDINPGDILIIPLDASAVLQAIVHNNSTSVTS